MPTAARVAFHDRVPALEDVGCMVWCGLPAETVRHQLMGRRLSRTQPPCRACSTPRALLAEPARDLHPPRLDPGSTDRNGP